MVAYLLEASDSGKKVIRILSDDTDVLVLLLYWVWKRELHWTCSVQMERWNGVVIDINASCLLLGSKCLQLMGMHALTGCDTVSYPFNKGEITVLNALKSDHFPGLSEVLANLKETGQRFFATIYGQPPGTSMNLARYRIYSGKKGKLVQIYHFMW